MLNGWKRVDVTSVLVQDDRTYIFYHVESFRPEKVKGSELEKHQRYAFIQMAELKCSENGIQRY